MCLVLKVVCGKLRRERAARHREGESEITMCLMPQGADSFPQWPQMIPLLQDHIISQGSLCSAQVALFLRSQTENHLPQTDRVHQRDLQSLYLTQACPWAPPSWSHKGAAWDPHRCTRAHQSSLTRSPSSGFHSEVSGEGSKETREI